jgi:hypothetical protein
MPALAAASWPSACRSPDRRRAAADVDAAPPELGAPAASPATPSTKTPTAGASESGPASEAARKKGEMRGARESAAGMEEGGPQADGAVPGRRRRARSWIACPPHRRTPRHVAVACALPAPGRRLPQPPPPRAVLALPPACAAAVGLARVGEARD